MDQKAKIYGAVHCVEIWHEPALKVAKGYDIAIHLKRRNAGESEIFKKSKILTSVLSILFPFHIQSKTI